MPIPSPPSKFWQNIIDAPLVQDASYAFTDVDRAYIDSQILSLETAVSVLKATAAPTLAKVSHAGGSGINASPYTVLSTDTLVEVDAGGTVTVNMDAAAATLEQHSVKNYLGDCSVNNITVSGSGHNIEDPNSLGTYSASVLMKIKGSSVTWQFDGTQWVIV